MTTKHPFYLLVPTLLVLVGCKDSERTILEQEQPYHEPPYHYHEVDLGYEYPTGFKVGAVVNLESTHPEDAFYYEVKVLDTRGPWVKVLADTGEPFWVNLDNVLTCTVQ